MPYIIRKIELRDFISHENTTIELGPGIIVFVGPNGAGKSSIVDAIYYLLALPKTARNLRGGKGNLVRNTSKTGRAVISITLEDPARGRTLQVRATLGKENKVEAFIDGVRRASQYSAAQKLVASELGIRSDKLGEIVEKSVVLRQNSLPTLISLFTGGSGREKREFLRSIFGVDDYRRAIEKLRDLQIRVGTRTAPASADLVRSLEEEAEKRRRDAEATRRSIEENRERLEKITAEIKALESRKAGLEGELEKLTSMQRDLSVEAERVSSQIRRAEEELAEIEKARREYEARGCPHLRKRLEEARHRLEVLRSVSDRLSPAESAKAELEKRVAELERAVEELGRRRDALRRWMEELGGRRPGEVIERREELRRQVEEFRDRVNKLELEANRLSDLISGVKRKAEELSRLTSKPRGGPEEVLAEAEKLVEDLTRKAEELQRRASELREEAGRYLGRAKDKQDSADVLARNLGAGRCPLCGKELGPGEAESLVRRLRREASQLRRRASELREEARGLEEEARSLLSRVRVVERYLNGLREALDRLSREGYESYEEALRRLRELQEELTRARRRLGELQGLLEEAEEEARKAQSVQALLYATGISEDSLSPTLLSEVEERLREEERKLKEARNELARLDGEISRMLAQASQVLGRRVGSAEEIVREIRRLEAEERRLQEQAVRCGALEDLLARRPPDELRAELERLKGERKRLSSKIRALEEELRRLKRERDELEDKIRDLRYERGRLEGEIRALSERLEKDQAEAEELERAARVGLVLATFRSVLDTVPELLYKRKLSLLEEEVSKVLSSMGTKYVEARAAEDKDDLRFILSSREGTSVDLAQLSGGEQTAFALAFVLGLNRMLAGNVGFLVLDEPTTHLDEDKRGTLAEILNELKSEGGIVDQVIIVSHERQLIDAADAVFEVRYEAGSSVVRELSGEPG